MYINYLTLEEVTVQRNLERNGKNMMCRSLGQTNILNT